MAWQQDLAPILAAVGGLRGNSNAFMQRWQELEQQKQQQEQLKQQQAIQQAQLGFSREANTRANAADVRAGEAQTATINRQFIDSISGLINDESLIDPAEYERRRALVLNTAPPTIERGFLEQTLRVEPSVFQQRAARARLKVIKADPYIKKLIESGEPITVAFEVPEMGANPRTRTPEAPDGKALWTIDEMEAVGQQMPRPAGSLPKVTPTSLVPNTPEEQFYQRFAEERGAKSFSALPTAQQTEARKTWMQSDDRPTQRAEPVVILQTVDAHGRPVTRVMPRSEAIGQDFATQPSAGQQTAMAEQEASIAQLGEIERLYRPEYVGPVVGRTARAQMQIPGAPDVGSDVAEFHASVSGLRNEIIRLISGAAVSGSEEARMRAQLPDVTDKPSVFTAKLAQTRRNRESLLARMQARTGSAPVIPTGGRASGAGPAKPARKVGRFEVIEH